MIESANNKIYFRSDFGKNISREVNIMLGKNKHMNPGSFLLNLSGVAATATEMVTTKPCTTSILLSFTSARCLWILAEAAMLFGSASLLSFAVQKSCASSKVRRGSSTNQNSVLSKKTEVSWWPTETHSKLVVNSWQWFKYDPEKNTF